MLLTPAEARERGDASEDQRAKLKALLETKRYPFEWRAQLFADLRDPEGAGLTTALAKSAIAWLEKQPDLDGAPPHATPEQVEQILMLLRDRVAPGPWARQIRDRITAGTLTVDQAGLYLADLVRLPKRTFVPAVGGSPAVAIAPDGYFGLAGSDTRVRCYRVHTVGGRQIVDQITGDRASQRRRIRGYPATEILRGVAADLPAAARRYGEARKRCSDCNQPLRNPDQPGYPHGYGPDCWAKRHPANASSDPTDPDPTEGAS